MMRLCFTRDSVCMADDVDAPHSSTLDVDECADVVAVAHAALRSGLLAHTTNAVWSLSLGSECVVLGRRWFRSFVLPVTRGRLLVRARDVEAVHARYWAQAEPSDIRARLATAL